MLTVTISILNCRLCLAYPLSPRHFLKDTLRLMPTRGITPFGLAHPPPSPPGDTLRGGGVGWLRCSDAPGGHQECESLRKVSGREAQALDGLWLGKHYRLLSLDQSITIDYHLYAHSVTSYLMER